MKKESKKRGKQKKPTSSSSSEESSSSSSNTDIKHVKKIQRPYLTHRGDTAHRKEAVNNAKDDSSGSEDREIKKSSIGSSSESDSQSKSKGEKRSSRKAENARTRIDDTTNARTKIDDTTRFCRLPSNESKTRIKRIQNTKEQNLDSSDDSNEKLIKNKEEIKKKKNPVSSSDDELEVGIKPIVQNNTKSKEKSYKQSCVNLFKNLNVNNIKTDNRIVSMRFEM